MLLTYVANWRRGAIVILMLFVSLITGFNFSVAPANAQESSEPSSALVVFIFDKSCKISCNTVRPIIRELQGEYTNRVQFTELDVSKDCLKESQKTAKSLGVSSFLSDAEDWYPAVGVFSARRKMVKQILGAKTKEMYKAAIEKAIAAK